MKRFSYREAWLLFAPLLLITGGLLYDRWKHRFETPQIDLNIEFESQAREFDWEIHIKGGPKTNYKIGWNEKLVAVTSRGVKTIWNYNRPFPDWNPHAVSSSEAWENVNSQMKIDGSQNNQTIYRHSEMELPLIPLDTQTLEWQVEVGAIPSEEKLLWLSPSDSQTLANWSLVKGNARLKRNYQVRYNPIRETPLTISRITPKSSNSQFKFQIQLRKGNRKSYRRLIAFDGKTKRTLWSDADSLNQFCSSQGNIESGKDFDDEKLLFNISKAEASWGEIVFIYDTVYDIHNRAKQSDLKEQFVDEKSLSAFEKQMGGMRFSKRIILRPKY